MSDDELVDSAVDDSNVQKRITSRDIDNIAAQLIQGNFILTALELHTEIVERGKEVPRLRDYFSNPANFEKDVTFRSPNHNLDPSANNDNRSNLSRAGSVSTFESLDWSHLSDDERDGTDRIAVLEFQLRKAEETIQQLRKSLTVSTRQESAILSSNSRNDSCNADGDETLSELDQKAVNFLVNEYLQEIGCRLTAISLADETQDQDFECWDDVGLNTSRPPSLSKLYLNFLKKSRYLKSYTDSAVQCELQVPNDEDGTNQEVTVNIEQVVAPLNDQITNLHQENEKLKSKIRILEEDIQNIRASDYLSARGVPDGSENTSAEEVDFSSIKRPGVPVLPEKYLRAMKEAIFVSRTDEYQYIIDVVKNEHDLVSVAGKSLPNLVANVLIQKRLDAIPLIIQTVTSHPDPQVRNQLLELLFNLIKKPDMNQRLIICQSCEIYAKRAGPAIVEAEILPLCWSQIHDKHAERRILVTETTTSILPYIDPDISSSLVLSILSQITEDKEELVVISAVKGLSYLLCYLETTDKFDHYKQLIFSLSNRNSESVVTAVKQYLVPCFAYWCMQHHNLLLNILESFIDAIEKMVTASVENKVAPTQTPTIDDIRFASYCSCVESFIPFLFVHILMKSPFAHKTHDPHPASDVDFSRFPQAVLSTQNILSTVSDPQHLAWLVFTFDEYLKETTHPMWEELRWVEVTFIPKIISLLAALDVNIVPCVNSMSTVTYTLSRVFGRPFAYSKIVPQFKQKLKYQEGREMDPEVFSGSVVPIFATGVLTAFVGDSDSKEIGTFMNEMIFVYSVCRAPLNSLRAATIALLSNKTYHELLVEILYECVINPSPYVKLTASYLLELLVKPVSEVLLSSKVVPAIITLSGDSNVPVKIGSLNALGSVLVTASSNDVTDKVLMQLDTVLDESNIAAAPILLLEALRMFTRIVNGISEKVRNEFLLPRLRVMAKDNNSCSSEQRRREIALQLFEVYSAVSLTKLPSEAISNQFLPGLRCLKVDLMVLGSEHEEVVANLIRNMEAQVGISTHPAAEKSFLRGEAGGTFMSKLKGLTK